HTHTHTHTHTHSLSLSLSRPDLVLCSSQVSYCEIYLDQIKHLLDSESPTHTRSLSLSLVLTWCSVPRRCPTLRSTWIKSRTCWMVSHPSTLSQGTHNIAEGVFPHI